MVQARQLACEARFETSQALSVSLKDNSAVRTLQRKQGRESVTRRRDR
jgi:hypothetical protein